MAMIPPITFEGCTVSRSKPIRFLPNADEYGSRGNRLGQMTIENLGIWDRPGKIKFWVNEERDVFSSFDFARASREGMKCHSVDVECVKFDILLKKYGVPYYLKLDAEGRSLLSYILQSSDLPEYVSVEAESLGYLLLLWQMGYRQFKIIDQMRHNSRFPDFTNDRLFHDWRNVCAGMGSFQEQGFPGRLSARLLRPTR